MAQPIDTAPKDGTPVFLWVEDRWIEGKWVTWMGGVWWFRWAEADTYTCEIMGAAPTHWMPVPPPPA